MSESVQVKIDGAQQIIDKLRQLPKTVARKVLSQSLRAGARVIQAQAKANAPVATGLLRQKIQIRSGRKRAGEDAVLKVSNAKEAFYGTLINKGWMKAATFRAATGGFYSLSKEVAAKHGLHATFKPGTHWFDRAFDYTDELALRVSTDAMLSGIEQAL